MQNDLVYQLFGQVTARCDCICSRRIVTYGNICNV